MKTFKEFINEEKQPLNEMATVCPKRLGYGFILRIFSDDHEPAHMHMIGLDGKEITRVVLSSKIPSKIDDIQEYPRDPKINNEQKKDILNWAKGKSKLGFNNWLYSMETWNTYQED